MKLQCATACDSVRCLVQLILRRKDCMTLAWAKNPSRLATIILIVAMSHHTDSNCTKTGPFRHCKSHCPGTAAPDQLLRSWTAAPSQLLRSAHVLLLCSAASCTSEATSIHGFLLLFCRLQNLHQSHSTASAAKLRQHMCPESQACRAVSPGC